jgi:ligand-binding sensor domain-containing protein
VVKVHYLANITANNLPKTNFNPNIPYSLYSQKSSKFCCFWRAAFISCLRQGNNQYQSCVYYTWATYTRDDGLPSNKITAIGVDGSYVWFGTDKGLSRYNKGIGVWALRTTEDGGLTSNMITAIAVEEEYVWFATDKGVARYDKKIDSWTTLTKSDGLAEDYITSIAIDEEFIWFGTRNAGVSIYSKAEQSFVKTLTRDDLLLSNKINVILVDGPYVWIGTANAGVMRFIKSVDSWIYYATKEGLPSLNITAMAVLGNYVWFGTYEDGLARFDKIDSVFSTFGRAEGLVCDNVTSLAYSDSSLWIGTKRGISRFSLPKKQWETYTKAQGLTTNYVTCVLVDDDKVWAGTSKGLGRFKQGRWKFFSRKNGLPDDFVLSITTDEHFVWVGTRGGLGRYDKEADEWQKFDNPFTSLDGKLKDNWITAIAVEDTRLAPFSKGEGNRLWIGTRYGLGRLDSSANATGFSDSSLTYYHASDGLAGDYINTIFVDEGAIWVGTRGGLSRYQNDNPLAPFSPLIKGARGLSKEDGRWHNFTTKDGLPNNNVRAIAVTKNSVWVGTPTGLGQYDRISGKWRRFDLTNPGKQMGHENVWAIFPMQSENNEQVWLGTMGGLSVFNPRTDSWRAIRSQEKTEVLRHSNIQQTELDGDWIWFSAWSDTSNGEIVRYDKRTDTWIQYTKEDVLLCDAEYRKPNVASPHWGDRRGDKVREANITKINWIEVCDDIVWFATNGGVLAYDKNSDTWRHYTAADDFSTPPDGKGVRGGLASNLTTTLMVDGKDVWIGLRDNRVCRYDRDADKWTTYTIVFNEVSADMEWHQTWRFASDDRYVWLPASWEGVARYDKQTDSWKWYTTTDGLSDGSIGCVVIDNNTVWAYGEGADDEGDGLSKYDANTDSWVIIDQRAGLAQNNIRELISGRDYLWVLYQSWWWFGRGGVAGSGFHRKNQKWQIFRGNPDSVGNDFIDVQETDSYVWFGSQGHGISRYDKASGAWTVYTIDDGLLSNRVNPKTLRVDGDYLWSGSSGGISRYDMNKNSWSVYTGRQALRADKVRSVVADGRYIWCGTEWGLSRYDKRDNTWTNVEWGDVNDLAVDDKYVWIAKSDGVSRLDKAANWTDRYEEKNGLPGKYIKTATTGHREVWVGTDNGVGKYNQLSDDPNAWETYQKTIDVQASLESKEYANSLVSNNIHTIAIGERYVWVGTERGVSRYDRKKELWVTLTLNDGLVSDEISSICIDGVFVWFGTKDGVSFLDTTHPYPSKEGNMGQWTTLTEADGLASDDVTCIAVNGDYVWFGTFDAGVSRYSKSQKTFKTFTTEDGLSHNSISDIAIDGDFVWFGTELGLSRYDTQTDTWTIFTRNFDEELCSSFKKI